MIETREQKSEKISENRIALGDTFRDDKGAWLLILRKKKLWRRNGHCGHYPIHH